MSNSQSANRKKAFGLAFLWNIVPLVLVVFLTLGFTNISTIQEETYQQLYEEQCEEIANHISQQEHDSLLQIEVRQIVEQLNLEFEAWKDHHEKFIVVKKTGSDLSSSTKKIEDSKLSIEKNLNKLRVKSAPNGGWIADLVEQYQSRKNELQDQHRLLENSGNENELLTEIEDLREKLEEQKDKKDEYKDKYFTLKKECSGGTGGGGGAGGDKTKELKDELEELEETLEDAEDALADEYELHIANLEKLLEETKEGRFKRIRPIREELEKMKTTLEKRVIKPK